MKLNSLLVGQSQSLPGFRLGNYVLLLLISSVSHAAEPQDISFKADIDGSEQRFVELLPPRFDAAEKTDVVIAFHGHGSDRWQFIRDERGECRGVRDVAARFGLIVVSPDYRAKTSWMGPKAEADVLQIIALLKKRHSIGRVYLAGGSMGGTAALTFTALHPELVAGVCSLNGTANLVEYDNFQDAIRASFGGTKTEVPGEYRKRSAEFWPERFTMPVAVTTGGKDTSVPPQSVLRLVEKLKQAGRPVLSIHRKTGGHSTNYEDTCRAMEFMLEEVGLVPVEPVAADGKLAASVTIIRDSFGVPHIYAPTDAGVVFGAAWTQAEDNWWQVEDNFIHALGRASEFYGEKTFISDYLVRALEIRRLSIEEYRNAPDAMRTLYDAYAAGFNDWLERHPGVERRLLETIEPWHTLALIRFKYHHNEFIGYAGLRQRGTELLLERPDYGLAGEPPKGSNQMALSGSRTASGHPMLLINPHVPFFGRGQYWEVHLVSDEGLEFSGLSRFGFMLPYMGNNEALGWAYTDNYADIGDLYRERFDDPEHPLRYRYGDGWREATEWREKISVLVDGKLQSREVRLRRTHHGPVLGAVETEGGTTVPVAVRLARLEEGGWLEQWYRMMRARSLEEFKSALAMLRVSYMNTLYADRDGNILYVYSAAIPRRSKNYDWRLPVDGSDPGTEWQGYHTLEELPQVLNPEAGFLQNCNSTPLQAATGLGLKREDFPAYLIGRETQNPRAVSATRILAGLSEATLDEFAEAVLDSHLVAAETMLAELFAEFDRLRAVEAARAKKLHDALTLLRQWDHEATLESKATTLFVRWAELLNRNNADAAPWTRITALEKAMAALEEDWGTWQVSWGEINRAQRPDASGRIPFSDDLPSTPVPGAPGWLGSVFTYSSRQGPDTRRRYGTHGNSFVKVIEFGPETEARSILIFGENGDPDSPHYLDQVEIYAAKGFKPAWWWRKDVEANAERTYRLVAD